MNVRSLGYRTDLFFFRSDASIVDRGEYLVVRSPLNPTFYWGNFLLFDGPPGPGDYKRWRDLFEREFVATSEVRHIALGWDAPHGEWGDAQPFLDEGFESEDSIVLTARDVKRPTKFCEEAEVRPIEGDSEWAEVLENHVAGRDEGEDADAWRVYAGRKLAGYRTLIEEGRGLWFGAFVDGQLAGDLGLFVFGGVGRFQTVGTHPDFRRRGVCGASVYRAARHALSHMNAEVLVMVADASYHAAKIYESVGFAPTERQVGLTWWRR